MLGHAGERSGHAPRSSRRQPGPGLKALVGPGAMQLPGLVPPSAAGPTWIVKFALPPGPGPAATSSPPGLASPLSAQSYSFTIVTAGLPTDAVGPAAGQPSTITDTSPRLDAPAPCAPLLAARARAMLVACGEEGGAGREGRRDIERRYAVQQCAAEWRRQAGGHVVLACLAGDGRATAAAGKPRRSLSSAVGPLTSPPPARTANVPQSVSSKGPNSAVYSNTALSQRRSVDPESIASSGALPLNAPLRPAPRRRLAPVALTGRPAGLNAAGSTSPERSSGGSKKVSDR
jgi:hypothetical protein